MRDVTTAPPLTVTSIGSEGPKNGEKWSRFLKLVWRNDEHAPDFDHNSLPSNKLCRWNGKCVISEILEIWAIFQRSVCRRGA